MFDDHDSGIGLLPGESQEDLEAEAQLAYEITCREMADGWTEPDRHVLPDGFEDLPLNFLAVLVLGVDRSRLNGHDAVRLMQAEARLESSFAAQKLASAAEVAHCPPGDASSPVERDPAEIEYASVEIATALRLTRRAAETLLDQALWLTRAGKRVWQRMAAGSITGAKVRKFVDSLSHLDTETVDEVLDATLDEAPDLTTGQLGYRLSKSVMTVDPDGSKSSMQEGLKDRKVVSQANPDFTGCLHVCSAHPIEIAAALRHVDRIAKALKTEDEPRSLDELRTDVAMTLLQGQPIEGAPTRGTGSVHMTVPLETLAEMSDAPGELGGYAPVIADVARQVAPEQKDGEWTWSVTHDGGVVATGTTRYRPRAAQRRKAEADYPMCVFPGSRAPASDCDLDHTAPFSEAGATNNDNLAPLSRYYHVVRHRTQWKYRRLPNGDHEWTSPLGHTYIRKRDPPD